MDKAKKSLVTAINDFFKDRFDLHSDKERDTTTIAEITKGVEFKGTNLWILIFAILIASIGLNVNSPAVIIGAMLISPLMGPIMGVGLGAGINDLGLVNKSIRNLGIAVGISIATSALYFWISPLHEAQSELLARTYPTLWDVLIAFFGGLAGIVAGSRREKSNAIPGVAIATALMPPLCTAGFALATANWYFFSGALFLFLINSVFISVSTFLIVRFMGFPRKKFEEQATEKRVKWLITFFVLITVIPSAYLAYNLVRESLFEENAQAFIEQEFQFDETQVIAKEVTYGRDISTIDITLYGKELDPVAIEEIESKMNDYKLKSAKLIIHQDYQGDSDKQTQAFEEMTKNMRFQLIEDLYKKNEELVKSKDEKIQLLEEELLSAQGKNYPAADITAELKVNYPTLKTLALSNTIFFDPENNTSDTTCLAVMNFSKKPKSSDTKKIHEWLKVRTKNDHVDVVIR